MNDTTQEPPTEVVPEKKKLEMPAKILIGFGLGILSGLFLGELAAPLEQMLLTTGLPAARTKDGSVIVFAATDFPHWTHLQSDIVAQLDVAYKAITPHPRLMLAGNTSGKFNQQVLDMDWTVETNLRNAYLPMLPWAMRDEELQNSN
jgi:hypothetical protein